MEKSHKMKGDYHGQKWTTWVLWEKGVKPSDIHRPFSAVCGEKAPENIIVLNWLWSFRSGKETAQVSVCE
jgi:hypothetical protein